MGKEIVNIESYQSPEPDRKIKIFTTDDGVRYVFEHFISEVEIYFSHRYYPNKPKGEKRDPSNYRLPEAVEEAANSRVTPHELEFLDGMIEEAELNQASSVKFSSNGCNQTA